MNIKMKDEEIELISDVLDLITNNPVTSLSSLLNNQKFKLKKGSDRLGMAISYLKGDNLIEEIPKTATSPIRYKLSGEGNRVKDLPGKYREFIEQKSVKEQIESDRLSKTYELTDLQISKIKDEISLQISKQQNEFYEKSIEKLNNELDKKARAIEKDLKLSTIQKNKAQQWTIWIALILSFASLLISAFK